MTDHVYSTLLVLSWENRDIVVIRCSKNRQALPIGRSALQAFAETMTSAAAALDQANRDWFHFRDRHPLIGWSESTARDSFCSPAPQCDPPS